MILEEQNEFPNFGSCLKLCFVNGFSGTSGETGLLYANWGRHSENR